MLVKAKEVGYFDLKLRAEGDEFVVDTLEQLGSWMEPVSDKDKAAFDKEMARRAEQRRKLHASREAIEVAQRAIVKSAASSLQSESVL